MFDLLLALAVITTVISSVYAIFRIATFRHQYYCHEAEGLFFASYTQIPIYFILLNLLYALPLPIRCLVTLEIKGDVSSQLNNFIYWLPGALLIQSVFFILFSLFYCVALRRIGNKKFLNIKIKKLNGLLLSIIWLAIFAISILMIATLARDLGGVLPMILSGYGVTEQFIGQNHLAVGFEWMAGLGIVLLSYSFNKKSKILGFFALSMILALVISYAIMGRRAALVVLGVSILVLINFGYRRLKWRALFAIVIAGFISLNFIGLIRGDSYDSVDNMIEVIVEKNNRNQAEDSVSVFYTLTEGNFSVPFETLPQIMRRFGDDIFPRFGVTLLNGFVFLIPNAIWLERPLPLSNWYMREFYDSNTPMNEGRQFYFLAESYLNFGPFGCVLWALIFGAGMPFLLNYIERRQADPLYLSLFSILIGSSLNFITSELVGGAIAFMKGAAFPVLILIFIKLIQCYLEKYLKKA